MKLLERINGETTFVINCNNPKYSVAYVVFAALLWSFAGLVIRGVALNPFWIVLFRNGLAGAICLPFCSKKSFQDKHLYVSVITFVFFMFGFVYSTKLAGAVQTIGGQYAAPFFVFLFNWMKTKRIPSLVQLICMATIGCGVALMIFGGSFSVITSLLPVSCGILFPIYSHSLKQCKSTKPFDMIVIGNLSAGIIALILLILSKDAGGLQVNQVLFLAGAGLLFNVFSYVIYQKGIQHIPLFNGMLLCLIEPVMSPLWVFLFLHEKPSVQNIIALVLILMGGTVNSQLLKMPLWFRKGHLY